MVVVIVYFFIIVDVLFLSFAFSSSPLIWKTHTIIIIQSTFKRRKTYRNITEDTASWGTQIRTIAEQSANKIDREILKMSMECPKERGHKYFPGELKRHLIQQFFLRALISVFSTSYVHPDEYFQSLR